MDFSVRVKNLTVRYRDVIALEDVNFELKHPSFLIVFGPNGSGKTTLLKSILGLINYEGHIDVFGLDVKKQATEVRRKIGYVPQRERIAPHVPVRVLDVILMGRLSRKGLLYMPKKTDLEKIKEVLKSLDIYDIRYRRFSHLSGGQQQRALIARALAVEPEILLLDEPFSGIDVASMEKIIEILEKIKREKKMTVIIVTHDLNQIMHLADTLLLLKNRVIKFGTVDEVLDEAVLYEAFGSKAKVIRFKQECYALLGDYHA